MRTTTHPFRWMRAAITTAVAAAWLTAVAVGMAALDRHRFTPGDVGLPPRIWPGEHLGAEQPDRVTVILVAHPRCPCTPTALDNLLALQATYPDRFAVFGLVVSPTPRMPTAASLRQRLESLSPGRVIELGPSAAGWLGVSTSSHVLAYDTRGRLVFSGGITNGRAHAGDNRGLSALRDVITQASSSPTFAPVYGCPLWDRGVAATATCCNPEPDRDPEP